MGYSLKRKGSSLLTLLGVMFKLLPFFKIKSILPGALQSYTGYIIQNQSRVAIAPQAFPGPQVNAIKQQLNFKSWHDTRAHHHLPFLVGDGFSLKLFAADKRILRKQRLHKKCVRVKVAGGSSVYNTDIMTAGHFMTLGLVN